MLSSKGYRIPIQNNEKHMKKLTLYSEVKQDYPGPRPKIICYKRSKEFLYVPRYYGIQYIGKPTSKAKEEIVSIDVRFKGDLRDYQKDIIEKTLENFKSGPKGGIWSLSTGVGKCLGFNTPVLMYNGIIKMVQDIKIGEKIMGDDNTPRTVKTLARGKEKMYEIKSCNGESYTVNESHVLSLKCTKTRKVVDIALKDFLLRKDKETLKGYRVAIDFPEIQVYIDPYTFGFQLNRGYIPYIYRCNSKQNRLKLLAGILDNIGHSFDDCIFINQNNKDIEFVVRSLGLACISKKGRTIIKGKTSIIPCLILKMKDSDENVLEYNFEVIPKKIDNYYGFEIDGNRRFVLGDLTVTHNTVIALNLITQIKVKTIIIVHKQILMDQWKERIQQFIPEASIGTIQGPVVDTQDKHIVVAMVQSLTRKEYPPHIFKEFGLLCVDECHTICSKTFSEALFMIQTKYRLGLSATPTRKDGFDKIFYYHIGPTIATIQKTVIKPTIENFFVPDTIEVAVHMTSFGKMNLPRLITDLAANEERNRFIIDTIHNVIEKEDRKMLVFSDRVGQCKALKNMFGVDGKTSGVFIGKNKKEQNAEALECDVIFATYGICKEGFDCPSLDTLLFATPKSDVVQAVGRILRQKNKYEPLVLDIVDKQLKGQWYCRKKFYNTFKN